MRKHNGKNAVAVEELPAIFMPYGRHEADGHTVRAGAVATP
jgi:hypothetical protein